MDALKSNATPSATGTLHEFAPLSRKLRTRYLICRTGLYLVTATL